MYVTSTLVLTKIIVHIYLSSPLAQVLLEGQDFYLLHLYAFNSTLYPAGAQ